MGLLYETSLKVIFKYLMNFNNYVRCYVSFFKGEIL